MRETPAPAGVRACEAVEVVRLGGWLPVRNRLRVELRPDAAGGHVAFATRAPLGIRLTGTFVLTPVGPGATRVDEAVSVSCPRLLRGLVVGEARRAQQALLANLKRRLEPGLDADA